ncbi:hypothetical protein G9U51_08300 [Calidifontibacter sp. DB0510]|uniref:Head-tail adaptor protein n=1 Tax=Metallococcus carri TaxID=1656884 RepID=A0A967AZ56_9MICO|nr:hypothetical protein [Metallococcus carri]NHN55776.1 hypothetical protein [Metallococcus carri]NOP38535.1 hypothetical protein [Calidifontibacter sp. DB2511S]
MPTTYKATVVRVRAGRVRSRYGNGPSEPDWDNASRARIRHCSIQPETGAEDTFRRDAQTAKWVLRRRGDADLTSHDRVEFAGATFEVGQVLRNREGRRPHLVAELTRTEG